MRRHSRGKRRAFTLMEVLLVAGILALLAAFAIPALMEKGNQARISITQASVDGNGPFAKALESYKWDMGKYPETDEGLAVLFQKKGYRGDERYKGPYVEGAYEQKVKDPWGQPLEYRCPGNFNEDRYDLWSRGPNREDDGGKEGSDDIKNWADK